MAFENKQESAVVPATPQTCQYPMTQKLPIPPVLLVTPEDLVRQLPAAEHRGIQQHDYYVQEREWSDDQLMAGWHATVPDTRQGRCTHCNTVTADSDGAVCNKCLVNGMVDESAMRTRKGSAQLPIPTLPAAPFHFRHVKHAMPDYPGPSQMQELLKREETRQRLQIADAIRVRQELHHRKIAQFQEKQVTEDPRPGLRKRARVE